MRLLYKERSKDATISANSQSVNYPVSNVIDSRLSRLYRTDGVTTADIKFNLGSAQDISSVAIANHNITSGASITLYGNTSSSFASPAFTQVLTWDEDIILQIFGTETYQYWLIKIVDPSNPDGYIEVGRAWIGEYFQTPGVAPTVSVDYNSASSKARSIGGQTYLDINYKYTNFGIRHSAITFAEKAEFQEVLDTVDTGIPYFIEFDETCSDLTRYYVTLNQEGYRFTTLSNNQYYTVSYEMIEEVE